jgi:hypothetical protein
LQDPPKFTQIAIFGPENKPSGNPVGKAGKQKGKLKQENRVSLRMSEDR